MGVFMNSFPLDEFCVGECGTLAHIEDTLPLRKRLLDLGWSKGTPIQVVRKSLFGDPFQLKVGDGQFAIRKNDAARIHVFKN